MKKQRQKIVFAALVVLTGLLAGTAAPEAFRMGTGAYAGLLSAYSLGRYGSAAAAPQHLLPYIVSVRVKTLLFLWMSCYTPAGFFFHLAYAWWLAASAGLLLSLFVIRDGYGGVLLFLCCVLPQWIVYGSMWKRELFFLAGRSSRERQIQIALAEQPPNIVFVSRVETAEQAGAADAPADRNGENGAAGSMPREQAERPSADSARTAMPRRAGDLAGLAKMTALCLVGCAAEAFLGTWTLKIFLQVFA